MAPFGGRSSDDMMVETNPHHNFLTRKEIDFRKVVKEAQAPKLFIVMKASID